jgi:hypothetical protein
MAADNRDYHHLAGPVPPSPPLNRQLKLLCVSLFPAPGTQDNLGSPAESA